MRIKAKKFRSIRKEGLEFQVPPKLATRIRQRVALERSSLSRVGTLLLCQGLGLDPAEFGIEITMEIEQSGV